MSLTNAIIFFNSNSNLTFIALNLHRVVDSKAQDNSNMQIQSPGTKTGWHHGEAIRENKLRRICLCVEIGFELLSKRGNSEWCIDVLRKWIPNSGSIKGKTEAKLLSGLVNCRLKFWYFIFKERFYKYVCDFWSACLWFLVIHKFGLYLSYFQRVYPTFEVSIL